MKGCLGIIVVFVLIGIGEYVLLGYTPLSGSYGLPILSASTMAVSAASIWGMFTTIQRRRALGVPPERWRDGDFVGFGGQIESDNAPLAAPASGEPAAIYEYDLKCSRQRGDDDVDVTAIRGMGMAGCHVQSGTQSFRLVGFP